MMDTILEVPELGFETANKIIQQQLVLILHAHSCQQKENLDAYDSDGSESSTTSESDSPRRSPAKKCELPFCAKTKSNLDHIRGCYDAESCMAPHCHATREIIKHWKSCVKKSLCPICKPVFKAQIKNVL